MSTLISRLGGYSSKDVNSLISHLEDLFTTRAGSLLHMPDYGVLDIALLYENQRNQMRFIDSLKCAIMKYDSNIRTIDIHKRSLKQNEVGVRLIITLSVSCGGKRILSAEFIHADKVIITPYDKNN